MRVSFLSVITITLLSIYNGSATTAGDCGKDQAPTCRTHCHRCCKHRCCDSQPAATTAQTRFLAQVPSGPVVESFPVMRAAPMMMAMPMMMVGTPVRTGTFQAPPATTADTTCASSQSQLADLDARVNALDFRMKTIQRTIELQTELLQELKNRGAFGTAPEVAK